MRTTILNTSILTTFGDFKYEKINTPEVKKIIAENGFISAIGHENTAQIISKLLSVNCPLNRIEYKQEDNEQAIVFKLNGRPEEGKIFSEKEIHKIGFSWGLLTKKKHEKKANFESTVLQSLSLILRTSVEIENGDSMKEIRNFLVELNKEKNKYFSG